MFIPFAGFFYREKIEKLFKENVKKIKKEQTMETYLIFIVIVIFANLVLYSSTIPNLLAGYLFGLTKGSILTLIGCAISSIVSFSIGGSMNMEMFKSGVFKNFYKNISNKSLSQYKKTELVFLSRLAPLFPYHIFTYFWSFVKVDFVSFLVGSLIGILPAIIFETYLGTKLNNIDEIIEDTSSKKYLVEFLIITVVTCYLIQRKVSSI